MNRAFLADWAQLQFTRTVFIAGNKFALHFCCLTFLWFWVVRLNILSCVSLRKKFIGMSFLSFFAKFALKRKRLNFRDKVVRYSYRPRKKYSYVTIIFKTNIRVTIQKCVFKLKYKSWFVVVTPVLANRSSDLIFFETKLILIRGRYFRCPQIGEFVKN